MKKEWVNCQNQKLLGWAKTEKVMIVTSVGNRHFDF